MNPPPPLAVTRGTERGPTIRTTCARRRLFRDWKELEEQKEELTTVTAVPTRNLFLWHGNLRPDTGPFAGIIFHVILSFPTNYPATPPRVKLCSTLDHPNVYGDWICLDMLQAEYNHDAFVGWTSAYSVTSILLQLQSFLFDAHIPQLDSEGGGYAVAHVQPVTIAHAIDAARRFVCTLQSHDGTVVQHTQAKPWPPFPPTRPWMAVTTTVTGKPVGSRAVVGFLPVLPASLYSTHLFSFLGPKELLTVRNVCCQWRRIVVTYNLFDRTQIKCFHSKATLNDPIETILGFGVSVQYYGGGGDETTALKEATSPLDLLSWHAFHVEQVRTGVWGGADAAFDYFLPLVFNKHHAAKALPVMEETIVRIMRLCKVPGEKTSSGITAARTRFFRPHMAFQLLTVLMNSMVVRLMKSSSTPQEVHSHTSEKALEGYCAFHHLLLFFAEQYPCLIDIANTQIDSFRNNEAARLKINTPNLGLLLVSLTLSNNDWGAIMKPFVMETLERNVRWNFQKDPGLRDKFLGDDRRLDRTFGVSITSLRLLMFQVYFISTIGRPSGTSGPFDVLHRYEKRLGKPTTAQKEDLLMNAKKILAVCTWNEFFVRIGGTVPTKDRLIGILKYAITSSERKGYHKPSRTNTRGNPGGGSDYVRRRGYVDHRGGDNEYTNFTYGSRRGGGNSRNDNNRASSCQCTECLRRHRMRR